RGGNGACGSEPLAAAADPQAKTICVTGNGDNTVTVLASCRGRAAARCRQPRNASTGKRRTRAQAGEAVHPISLPISKPPRRPPSPARRGRTTGVSQAVAVATGNGGCRPPRGARVRDGRQRQRRVLTVQVPRPHRKERSAPARAE